MTRKRKKRRITSAVIKFLSLVPRGANRLPTILKDDGAFNLELLTKFDSDFANTGELTAVAYAPEIRDSQGDIASAAVVKEMLHSFAKNGSEIDVRHDGKPVGRERAFVAEQFLVQKSDERFHGWTAYDGSPVDLTGAWAVTIKIEDPQLRSRYESGGWNGVSMGGFAEVAAEKESTPEDFNMTKEEIEALAKSVATATAAAIVEAQKEQPKPQPKPEDKLVFKGDPTDRKAVELHLKKVAASKVDWSDPEAVQKHLDSLDKSDDGEPADADGADDSEELKKAKAELKKQQELVKKLTGKSQQPGGGKPKGDLEKSDEERYAEVCKAGQEMADWINKRNGYAVAGKE